MPASREQLIKDLWPDKILYGSVLLIVSGLTGVLFGLLSLVVTVGYSSSVPELLRTYPAWLTVLLSGAAAGLAYLGLQQRNTNWSLLGGVAGVLSLGLLGVGSLFALAALGFLALSRKEGEDLSKATLTLRDDMWPDKSLAASLLLSMEGVVTLAWGAAIAAGAIGFQGLGPLGPGLFGPLALLVGAACLAAAWQLYHQRGPVLGLVASLLGIAALGLYIIGPVLGIGALYYLMAAQREREFDEPGRRASPTGPKAPSGAPPRPPATLRK